MASAAQKKPKRVKGGHPATKAAKAAEAAAKNAAEIFRSQALAEALERQDMAAVALALRNGNTVVPLINPGDRDRPLESGEVWTYRDPKTGEIALLLFSDARNKPENLPPTVGLQGPEWLKTFLRRYSDEITTVFLDIAGPHPMQASPDELLAALEL